MNEKAKKDKIYSEETITIIKPFNVNHIFNEERFEISSCYLKNGNKLIILRERDFNYETNNSK